MRLFQVLSIDSSQITSSVAPSQCSLARSGGDLWLTSAGVIERPLHVVASFYLPSTLPTLPYVLFFPLLAQSNTTRCQISPPQLGLFLSSSQSCYVLLLTRFGTQLPQRYVEFFIPSALGAKRYRHTHTGSPHLPSSLLFQDASPFAHCPIIAPCGISLLLSCQ